MNILAIDCSSARGEVACLRDEEVVATAGVAASRNGAAALFAALEEARTRADWPDWSEVDLFAAGRGPGRYSGMRVALTAAQHLALPGHKPVRAIDSGRAMAAEWAATSSAVNELWILGDARRDRVWRGRFACKQGAADAVDTWSLLTVPECVQQLNQLTADNVTWVISSEWDRLQPLIDSHDETATAAWRRVSATPSAEWVGRLAACDEVAAVPSVAPVPLYLHPPVEPRLKEKGSGV